MSLASHYLRRIFEYIIENEYDKINTEISEKKVSFDEKMKAVDKKWNIIPDELDSQKSKIYQVLRIVENAWKHIIGIF